MLVFKEKAVKSSEKLEDSYKKEVKPYEVSQESWKRKDENSKYD